LIEDNAEGYLDEEDVDGDSFIEKMRERVKVDFKEAEQFLNSFHHRCVDAFTEYHNAANYESLRKVNKFPYPLLQTLVDTFVSHVLDKLFYRNRPCTIVGVEQTDEADAEAKQDMMNWQDYQDNIYGKSTVFLHDVALHGVCCAQVDYHETFKKVWQIVDVPVVVETPEGPVESVAQEWKRVEIPKYKGARVRRVDPVDLFFGPDKEEVDDDFPVMVRSKQAKRFFKSQSYFINYKAIKDTPDSPESDPADSNKREMIGLDPSGTKSSKVHEYIEWVGLANKAEVYKFMLMQDYIKSDAERMATMAAELKDTKPDEECWTICGLCDGEVVVRLEKEPLDLDRPNVVIGTAEIEENELIGGSLAFKSMAVHKGMQTIFGILLENLKQSVNAMHIINTSALKGNARRPLVNKAGTILEVTDNVNNVHKRVEQPRIASDIYTLLDIMKQMGHDTSGVEKILMGQGDPAADTLGEANMAAGQAELRMRNALRTFETTFVEPLYRMRNEINANFLDQEYAYGVIGESAIEWRTIDPSAIRANVDFLCESSTRETNRAVIGQQLLQMIDTAPAALNAGQPVRVDLLMKHWLESIGTMKESEVLKFFPMIQMEEQTGQDFSQVLAAQSAAQQMISPLPAEQGGEVPGGPGNTPQPMTEGDAIQSANQKTQTQVGK